MRRSPLSQNVWAGGLFAAQAGRGLEVTTSDCKEMQTASMSLHISILSFFQITLEMREFRQRIAAKCRNGEMSATNPHNSTLTNILVSNQYKTLFCFVPKVACGNWKRIFLVLNGQFNTTAEISGPTAHDSGLLDTLDKYSTEEIEHKLQTYKKIVFIREPLERLLSAYRNKFTASYHKRFRQRYAKAIIKKYRKNLTEVPDEDHVTLNEFVKYLIHLRPKDRLDVHWELQHKLCTPCSINYDFIGKYESLRSDAARTLSIMGASEKVTFPDIGKRREGQDTKTLMKKFYSQISEREFLQLREIYNKDYEIFEYRKPIYSSVAMNGSKPTIFFKRYIPT